MDFCSITAGSLLQKDAGVKFLNEFHAMAKKSKYGMILFVDEADSLFVPRESINISTEQGLEHYKVLNHLLAMTGDGSDKFMLICSTNHAENLDEAMGRRFQDRILIPLPDADARTKLIKMYAKKLLFNAQSNGAQLTQSARNLFSDSLMKKIVELTQGLSAAEIKNIIEQIRNLGMIKKLKQLTIKDINMAVTQGVNKKKQNEEDNKKRVARNHNGTIVHVNIQSPQDGKNITSNVPIITAS